MILIVFTTIAGTMLRPLISLMANQLPLVGGFNFDRLFLYAPFFWVCAAVLAMDTLPFPSITGTLNWLNFQWKLPVCTVLSIMVFFIIVDRSIASFRVQLGASLALERMGEHWHRFYQNPELKALATEIGNRPVRTVTAGAEDSPKVWQPSYNLAYGLETADGFKTIYPQRFHQFWRLVVDPAYNASENNLTKRFMDVEASRMYIFPPHPDKDILPPDYNLNLLSLANVGFFISSKPQNDPRMTLRAPVFTDAMFEQWLQEPINKKILHITTGKSYLGPRLYIYENSHVLPRFRLVPTMVQHADEKKLLAAISAADIRELENTVHTLAVDTSAVPVPEAGGTVNIERYSLEEVELSTASTGTSMLIVANTYSKFWKCTIDGHQATIFPAYHVFMGVSIPRGTHKIRLVYDPPYRKWVKFVF